LGTWYGAGPIVQAQNQFVFPVGGGITAASRNIHVLDTFAIGWDRHVWNTGSFDDGDGWHPAYEPTTNHVHDEHRVQGGRRHCNGFTSGGWSQ
jgi:hypothetical protein